jgi:hypothetical protein
MNAYSVSRFSNCSINPSARNERNLRSGIESKRQWIEIWSACPFAIGIQRHDFSLPFDMLGYSRGSQRRTVIGNVGFETEDEIIESNDLVFMSNARIFHQTQTTYIVSSKIGTHKIQMKLQSKSLFSNCFGSSTKVIQVVESGTTCL